MIVQIKQIILESDIMDTVQQDLTNSLYNQDIASQSFEQKHLQHLHHLQQQKEQEDSNINDKNKSAESINENINETRNKYLHSGNPSLNKNGYLKPKGLTDLDKRGENAQLQGVSKKNSDAYAARSLVGGNKGETPFNESTSLFKGRNLLTQKNRILPNYHDSEVGIKGNRPILKPGEKFLRKNSIDPMTGTRNSIANGESSYTTNRGVATSTAKQDKYR